MRHDEHHAAGVGQLAQHQHHLPVQRRVQPGGRFVQDQQRRSGEQLERHRGALALAAGQLVHPGVGVLGQLEFLEHLGDHLGPVALAGVGRQPQLGGIAECLVDRQLAVHDVVLGDHADPAAHGRVLGVDVVTLEGHRARGGAGVSGDQPRQRGFAGAGPADDGGQRPGPGGQRDVVEQLLSVVDGEGDRVHLQAAGARRRFGAADQGAVAEHQVDVADGDHVAVGQDRRSDPDPVDECAVDAVRVPDLGAQRSQGQERVVA